MKCATDILSGLQADCQPQETIMVGTTLQNMMGAYEGVCKFKCDVNISSTTLFSCNDKAERYL